METIKKVADLPEWFTSRKYRKSLGPVDWYREVRSRTAYRLLRDGLGESATASPEFKSNSWKTHLLFTDWERNPASFIFEVDQNTDPVEELSIFEAFFLSESVSDPALVNVKRELGKLLEMWRKEHEREDAVVYSREYEVALENFVNLDDPNETGQYVDVNAEGNPFLSYGRPLSGYPITVDTQYDDATIIEHFKKWLSERRRLDGERAPRPFNENDFSDWEFYKIREIHDLELWARLHDVKILDRVMAAALWPTPADSFSPTDVLRTTARRKAAEVFRNEVAIRMYGQLRLQIGEKFLEK